MNVSPDNYSGSLELYLPTTVGRALMGKPNKFTAWLRDEKILWKKGNALKANLRYENRGYLMYETTGDTSESWEQVYFTSLGLNWITGLYEKTKKQRVLTHEG